jgi:GNAT superfamily N-acetyltransferase
MARTGHVKKMARVGGRSLATIGAMHTRYQDGVTIRALRDGDTQTVAAVFARLSDQSRRHRFGGPKPRLADAELAYLSRVDADHHVLVAYVDGDPRPAGIGRFVRIADGAAEVAFEVADELQGRGIGTALARVLAGDARAAGVVELHATVTGEPRPVRSLLARSTRRLRATWLGGECALVAALD